jgi:hypothetical protein
LTRLALVAVAVIAAVTLALPAVALAKSVTRIVVAKTATVHNPDAGTTAWPYSLTVKLQRRISGSHYHALSGTVKVYRWDVDDEAYGYLMSKKGSTISFSIPERGKYKFVYSGSGTMKPCTAYSTIMEDVGFTIVSDGMTVTPVNATQSWITVAYTVGWNTTAWDWRPWFGADLDFGNTEADNVVYQRWLKAPGAVEFTFKVNNVDILTQLYDNAWAFVDPDDDPYIVESQALHTVHYFIE